MLGVGQGMTKKYNIKSVGLSEKYKKFRKKRILYLRDEVDPPISWYRIAKRFHIGSPTAVKLYEEAKSEQKQREAKTKMGTTYPIEQKEFGRSGCESC